MSDEIIKVKKSLIEAMYNNVKLILDNIEILKKQFNSLKEWIDDRTKNESIICAAIWYKDITLVKEGIPNQNPINVDRGAVFCGHRHPHCMWTMVAITGIASKTNEVGEYIQGFLTNKNRFVDREEAAIIAYNARQIKDKKVTLYSEDLY